MAASEVRDNRNVRTIPHLRWWIIGLICLATTINYIDRQTISQVGPIIRKQFSISPQGFSWIVFWFLLAYAVMQIVAGAVIDRVGTKRGFTISIIWWSLANMLTAFGNSVTSFSIYRFLLGVGEAGNYPAALKAIAEWFPKSERSTAVGILNAGPGLGSMIAPPLLSFLILRYGWPASFVITGAIGFLWLLAWQWIYFKPAEHPRLTVEEAALIHQDNQQTRGAKIPWLHFFRYPEIWGLMLSRFVCDGAFYFFTFWLPNYLSDVRGFNTKEIGMFAWIPFLAADLGSLFGGWMGSRLIRQGMSVNHSRKLMMWLGAVLVLPLVLLANSASSAWTGLALIAGAMFALQLKSSSLFTVPADLVRPQDVASVWGLSGAAGSLGGMLFTPFIGWLVQHYSYAPVFQIVSVMHLVSVAIVMLMIPRIEPLKGLTER